MNTLKVEIINLLSSNGYQIEGKEIQKTYLQYANFLMNLGNFKYNQNSKGRRPKKGLNNVL